MEFSLCRCHSGFYTAAIQDDLSRSEILLLPWGAVDENATNARSPLTDFQPDNRYN